MKIVTNQELSLEVSPTENKDLFEALQKEFVNNWQTRKQYPPTLCYPDKVLHLLSISRPMTIEAFETSVVSVSLKRRNTAKNL